jgi:hypothetical protein
MKLTRQTMSNIAIALVAVLLFAGFVMLATKGGNKDNGDLATVAPTTTEKPTTSTTLEETTTTASTLLLPTTTVPGTATTRVTTATTAKPKPATTTTAKAGCASGQQTEPSDQKNSFSYNGSGWTSGSSDNQPGHSSFPLEFTITTAAGQEGRISFHVELTNNTACAATFPGNPPNIAVAITLHPTSGGDDITFTISPPSGQEVGDIRAHETIKLTQERALSGSGTYEATGAVVVNYG